MDIDISIKIIENFIIIKIAGVDKMAAGAGNSFRRKVRAPQGRVVANSDWGRP